MGSPTYSNRSDLGWLVQKFGGTSVGKFPEKVPSPMASGLGLAHRKLWC